MSLEWFDTHCHFDFPEFAQNRRTQWAEARDSGLVGVCIPGVSMDDAVHQFQVIAETHYSVGGVGLHPWWISKTIDAKQPLSETVRLFTDRFEETLIRHQPNAVGECGLDAVIDTPIEIQEALLAPQLSIARERGLPVILHVRQAHHELLSLLKRYGVCQGVVHAFTGSYELAMSYRKLGLSLGIGGAITYARASKTRKAVARLPLEALVLETDAPSMPLSGKQGEVNTVLNIPRIGEVLAVLRNETVSSVARETTDNAKRLLL